MLSRSGENVLTVR